MLLLSFHPAKKKFVIAYSCYKCLRSASALTALPFDVFASLFSTSFLKNNKTKKLRVRQLWILLLTTRFLSIQTANTV